MTAYTDIETIFKLGAFQINSNTPAILQSAEVCAGYYNFIGSECFYSDNAQKKCFNTMPQNSKASLSFGEESLPPSPASSSRRPHLPCSASTLSPSTSTGCFRQLLQPSTQPGQASAALP